MTCTTKFFEESNQVKAWINKWYKVCQTPTLAKFQQARSELWIADLVYIAEYHNSLFEYID